MANISQIKLPNNTTYNIKDNSAEKSGHIHDSTSLVPIQSKTFTDVIGTANNWSDATFFFGSIRPTAWGDIWKIKFKVQIYVPGNTSYMQLNDVMWSGSQGSLRTYSSMNTVVNHLAYYGVIYRLKSAGYTNGYGHSAGCRFYSSNYPIDPNYKRTIVVDILETENCSFTFYDSCLKYAAIPGTGSTNYDSYSEVNWCSNGLQEAGDSDTLDDRQIYFGGKTSTSKGVWAGSLFMEDGNGTYQNICAASDGTITASNRTVGTTKIANTSGFKIGGKIYYSNTNYGPNTNISGYGVVYNSVSLFDSRYAFNTTLTAGSLTTYKPIYLVGTINDGLFYLDQTWWTQTPEDSTKIYVLVGGVYDSTTSNCRIDLYQHNPWYYYDGSKLVPYIYRAENVTGTVAIANGGTGQTTATNAINALLGGLPVWSATPTDTTYFMRQDTGGSASYGKVPFSTLWTYISGKLPSWSQASSKPTYTFSEITSKPTTLSGYGITDANISSGTITLGSNTITPLTSSSTLNAAKLSGAIPSAVTATTQTAGDNSTKIATTAYVDTAITNLPEPMLFKGTVGTGGTITSLPAAAAANEGFTYKVITALTTPVTAKVGDTVISNGSVWTVIPSGDEPSGTVTNITAGAGLNTTSADTGTDGGSISTSGTLYLTKSGATAGSYGDSSAQTPGYGSTFKVPYVTVDKYGRVTGISEHTVKIPASDNTNTTYTLTNALSSHKYTWTFTAGGSGSGSTTTVAEFVQGTGITLTDDTTNKKITITNSGVRSISTGSANGTISVNTNGTSADVAVKGLGSNAYTSTAYLPLAGGSVTGPVSFGDSVTMEDLTTESLVVEGSASIVDNLAVNSINGVTVGNSPKFTDTVPTTTQSKVTGISIAAHGTGTVIGVQSSTTTASKVTLGTAISVPNVTGNADVTVPIRADADTTVPVAASAATTVPIKNTSATTVPTAASSATVVPIKNTDATACDDITSWSAGSGSFTSGTFSGGSGSFTQGSFSGGSGSASLTFTMDTTDTKKLKIAFSHTHNAATHGADSHTHVAATHGADSHTHTAPSLGYTARSIIGVQSTTTSVTGVSGSTSIYGVQSTTTSVTGVSGSTSVRGVKTGDNSTTTASKVTLGTAKSIPNVTAATDVTVPIKNTSSSTFVTGTTHTITDNGHTHSI